MAAIREFTTGISNALSTKLLGEKLQRMIDSDAFDAIKILSDSGFGGDVIADSPYEYEKLLRSEDIILAAFIKKYAPKQCFIDYFLLKNDYDNLEALMRKKYLGLNEEKMISPCGILSVDVLSEAVEKWDISALGAEYSKVLSDADKLFTEEKANGFSLDNVFTSSLYKHLIASTKNNLILKKLVRAKIDALNIYACFRSRNTEIAEEVYIPGGNIRKEDIKALCEEPPETLVAKFEYSEFYDLVVSGADALMKKQPLSELEKNVDGYPLKVLKRTEYFGKGDEPFLLYCLKKQSEIANVRIIMSGLLSGLDASFIRERLREI